MDRRAWIFLGAGAIVLAALFVWLRPGLLPTTDKAPAEAPPAEPGAPTRSLPTAVQLVVKQGQLASGPTVVGVTQGDEVRLVIVSDLADELHLHGYNLHVDVRPGIPAELRFVADRSGRFEYELHGAQAELGVLEVHPK